MSDNKSSFKPGQKPQSTLREFNVGMPEDNFNQQYPEHTAHQPTQEMSIQEMEQMARQAREEKFANMAKISDSAKKRIELLSDIGRLTKDVAVGGITFSIRTLKSKEMRDASFATFTETNTQLEASYEARKQQLARAIYQIDHQDIDFVIGSKDLDARFVLLDSLEETVIGSLWDEFIKLKEEARTKFGLSSDKDTKEVVEDLKK
jgi:hypothetical protein